MKLNNLSGDSCVVVLLHNHLDTLMTFDYPSKSIYLETCTCMQINDDDLTMENAEGVGFERLLCYCQGKPASQLASYLYSYQLSMPYTTLNCQGTLFLAHS